MLRALLLTSLAYVYLAAGHGEAVKKPALKTIGDLEKHVYVRTRTEDGKTYSDKPSTYKQWREAFLEVGHYLRLYGSPIVQEYKPNGKRNPRYSEQYFQNQHKRTNMGVFRNRKVEATQLRPLPEIDVSKYAYVEAFGARDDQTTEWVFGGNQWRERKDEYEGELNRNRIVIKVEASKWKGRAFLYKFGNVQEVYITTDHYHTFWQLQPGSEAMKALVGNLFSIKPVPTEHEDYIQADAKGRGKIVLPQNNQNGAHRSAYNALRMYERYDDHFGARDGQYDDNYGAMGAEYDDYYEAMDEDDLLLEEAYINLMRARREFNLARLYRRGN